MISDLTKLKLLLKRKQRSSIDITDPDQIVIGTMEQGQPVIWPAPSLQTASHSIILASSGSGKTVLIANALALEFAKELKNKSTDKQTSFFIVDPKGDLSIHIQQALTALDPTLLSKLYYLNPFEQGFPLNLNRLELGNTPLDVRALQLANLTAVVSTGVGKMRHLGVGARQVDVLLHIFLAALASDKPEANILWALDALNIKQGLKRLAQITTSKRAKQFLFNAYLSDELRASCGSRLRTAFALTSKLEQIVSSDKCLNFSKLLKPGRMTILDLGRPTGGILALSEFWANLFVRLVHDHLMERPSPYDGHFCRIIIDEVQIVSETLQDIAESMLTIGRSKGIGLCSISQGTALISDSSPTLLPVLFSNTNNKFVGRLNAQDAEILARTIAPSEGIDQTLGEVRSKFISRITNMKDREFYLLQPASRERFVSLKVDMKAWKKAEQDQSKNIQAMKDRLALPTTLKQRLTLDEAVPYQAKSKSKNQLYKKQTSKNNQAKSPWG